MKFKQAVAMMTFVACVALSADAIAQGTSPIQQALQNARGEIEAGNPAAAEGILQDLFDGGFTAVGVLTADETINSLQGRAKYDGILDAMARQAYPCAYDNNFDDFDFWVGDWEVHTAAGQFAGSNSIKKAERGCVLIENWSNFIGGTGMSINYFDVATSEWVQVWNAEGGSQINIRGGLTEEGMLLTGTIATVANPDAVPFRGLWTLLDDGRVRQYFEQSNDGGDTWQPWFEGFYSRVDTNE